MTPAHQCFERHILIRRNWHNWLIMELKRFETESVFNFGEQLGSAIGFFLQLQPENLASIPAKCLCMIKSQVGGLNRLSIVTPSWGKKASPTLAEQCRCILLI